MEIRSPLDKLIDFAGPIIVGIFIVFALLGSIALPFLIVYLIWNSI